VSNSLVAVPSTPSISPDVSGSNPSDGSPQQAWSQAFDTARLGEAAQDAGWQPVAPTPWLDAASTRGGAEHSDAYNATVRAYQPYYNQYRNFDQLNSDQQLDARRQVAHDDYLGQTDKAFIQDQFTDRLNGKPAVSLDEFAGPAARFHDGGARVLGGLQAVGGAFEMTAGGAMLPTGLGAAPGAALLFHGVDNVYHGGWAMAGQQGPTWTHRGLDSAFRSVGVPDRTANGLATLSELGIPFGGAFAAARLPGSLVAAGDLATGAGLRGLGARTVAGEGAQAGSAQLPAAANSPGRTAASEAAAQKPVGRIGNAANGRANVAGHATKAEPSAPEVKSPEPSGGAPLTPAGASTADNMVGKIGVGTSENGVVELSWKEPDGSIWAGVRYEEGVAHFVLDAIPPRPPGTMRAIFDGLLNELCANKMPVRTIQTRIEGNNPQLMTWRDQQAMSPRGREFWENVNTQTKADGLSEGTRRYKAAQERAARDTWFGERAAANGFHNVQVTPVWDEVDHVRYLMLTFSK